MLPKKFPIKKTANRVEITHYIGRRFVQSLVRFNCNPSQVLEDFISIDPYRVGTVTVLALYGHRPLTCKIDLDPEPYEGTLFP